MIADAQPLSRGRAFVMALLALWIPHLLPFARPWFTACDHCTKTWIQHFVELPGFLLGMAAYFALDRPGTESAPFVQVAAAVATLALALLLAWALRRWSRVRWWIVAGVMLLASGHAILLAHMCRA